MASSRRISNIEVAGIATVALGVAGVLTSSCYPLGERGATQDEQIAGDSMKAGLAPLLLALPAHRLVWTESARWYWAAGHEHPQG